MPGIPEHALGIEAIPSSISSRSGHRRHRNALLVTGKVHPAANNRFESIGADNAAKLMALAVASAGRRSCRCRECVRRGIATCRADFTANFNDEFANDIERFLREAPREGGGPTEVLRAMRP